jgi:alpha-tubulin suppressor-like RCC1 family protein
LAGAIPALIFSISLAGAGDAPHRPQPRPKKDVLHDGYPKNALRAFEGDNIGDGKVVGDQYTGGLFQVSPGGDVYAWGMNDFGQLGDGTRFSTNEPVLVPVLRGKNITWLSAGDRHTIAANQDGAIFAWGANNKGQLGLSDAALGMCSTTEIQSSCDGPRPDSMIYPSNVADLWGEYTLMTSTRGDSNLAVTKRMVTFGWGENSAGQLGTGDKTDRNIPTQMESTLRLRFVLVAAGGEHSIALTALGEVYVWGSNAFGQLGQDTLGMGARSAGAVQSSEPLRVPGLQKKKVIKVAAGWAHCMALTDSGDVWVWGRNNFGQLGVGDTVDRFGAVLVQAAKGGGSAIGVVAAIAAGQTHSVFLNTSGIPFTAGRNDAGQLGVGDTMQRASLSMVVIPKRIWCDTPFGSEISQSFQDWVCVGSMVRDQCGQRCKDTLLRTDCGPKNASAGLLVSDCEPLMPISQKIIKIEAGDYTTFAISEDYNLYAWGSNANGQIGIGEPSLWGQFIARPQLVVNLYGKNVSAVAGGSRHTVAKASREPFFIRDMSPASGPITGGTSVYIIGQGFNTFTGNLSCVLSMWTNGTHAGQYPFGIDNARIETIVIPAERYSNVRMRCKTPDVRYIKVDGTIDAAKMAKYAYLLNTPRNLTILWGEGVTLPSTKPLVFYYTGLPGITGILPEGGPVTGDTYVLIEGYNFDKMLASDVRVRFGDSGNNWMRGCVLSDTLMVTLAPPTGPSDSGTLDFDGACNDLCPEGFDLGCMCSSINDASPECVKGIVRATVDPRNRASRRDRCTQCAFIEGPVNVRVSLNGFDYSTQSLTFTYFGSPSLSYITPPPWVAEPEWLERSELTYGGPSSGGTTVDIHGLGLSPTALGRAVCLFGCSYSDQGNGIGPRCTPGTARHSLPLPGVFRDAHTFVFRQPAPSGVWDLIHFGTWFHCDGSYGAKGCDSYNQTSGVFKFNPAYDAIYAPTFRSYNSAARVSLF